MGLTEGLSGNNVALWEDSPAREGGVPGMATRPTPPSRAGLPRNRTSACPAARYPALQGGATIERKNANLSLDDS